MPPALLETKIHGVGEYSDLYIELRRGLERNGAHVIAAADTASAILVISKEVLDRHVLSVDAQGRASEYELNYSVSFEVQDKTKQTLLPAQTVYQLRDYKFDPDNVLATDTEETILRKALIAAATQQILRRIEAGLRNPVKKQAAPVDKKS